MSFLESLFRFLSKAICGSQTQEQQPPSPVGQQHGQPVSYPPQHQQQQQQHQYGKPYHHNDYLANAQDPQYVSLRQRAADLEPELDRLFGASRAAFESGDGAGAKELSNSAKALKAEKEKLNQEAAKYIFEKNNQRREPGEIDLHGLRADEAVQWTEQFIVDSRKQGLTDLRLIVGKGIHSQNHEAVLKPRIEQLMQKHSIIAELDPDNSGVLLVHLGDGGRTGGPTIDPEEITKRLGDEEKGCIIM